MSAHKSGIRSSWVWLLGLFTFGSLIETFFYGQLGAFTPLYLPHLGIAPGDVPRWTGIIAALTGILGLPFLPFWGALADRYARKPIIIRSFVVHLAAATTTMLAGNVWVFLLGRSFSSLALGNSGLMMTTLAERAPANRRGLAFSLMNSAAPIGVFIGPLVGGPILDRWDFRTILGVNALLMLTVVLALSLGYRDDFKGGERRPLLAMAGDSVRVILGSRRLRALFPALFLLFAGWMLAMTYIPVVISQLYPSPDQGTRVGLIMGAGGLVALILAPLLGILADRYGHWRFLFASALLEMLLWPLPALVHGLTAFGAAWALINGLASAVFAISFSVLAGSATDKMRGRVMSFAYLPVSIGGIVGPAIGSIVTRSSLLTIFPFAAVLTALGIGLLALAARQSNETAG